MYTSSMLHSWKSCLCRGCPLKLFQACQGGSSLDFLFTRDGELLCEMAFKRCAYTLQLIIQAMGVEMTIVGLIESQIGSKLTEVCA